MLMIMLSYKARGENCCTVGGVNNGMAGACVRVRGYQLRDSPINHSVF